MTDLDLVLRLAARWPAEMDVHHIGFLAGVETRLLGLLSGTDAISRWAGLLMVLDKHGTGGMERAIRLTLIRLVETGT